MTGLVLLSLFMVHPLPLEMPRATSYLVNDGSGYRLEDRYSPADLWASRTFLGSWTDDDGRIFTVARLSTRAPEAEDALSRVQYAKTVRPIDRRDDAARQALIASMIEIPIAERPERPRHRLRDYREVLYWQGTNTANIICEFCPKHSEKHYLAAWKLAEGDDFDERLKFFEAEFLTKEFATLADFPSDRQFLEWSESEALRADAHDSVTNFAAWHWTDVAEYTVLDDLTGSRELVNAITNQLPELRAQFVRALPTPLADTNMLGVVRVFGSRDEYLLAVDESLSWTSAYWSPLRREIVAYLPPDGLAALLRTFRHEAFHQYLSYATAMIPASPWLNEGYAQYFESAEPPRSEWSRNELEELEPVLRAILAMDYPEFYDGSDRFRQLKYRLAWSLAAFIERGARKVRNDPFKDFKSTYLKTLVGTQDMRKATEAAFGNADNRDRFVYEWKKFWKDLSVD